MFRSIDPDSNFIDDIFDSLQQHQQSSFYTVDQYNVFTKNKSYFTVFNYNIRSFNANGDAFLSLFGSLATPPDCIVLTETWLTDDNKNICNIDGYISYHTVRQKGRSGGVSVFCDSLFTSDVITELCISNETIESCVVRLQCGIEKWILFAIYRPHSDSVDNFNRQLQVMMNHELLRNQKVILMGDLNINLLVQGCVHIDSFVSNLQSLHYLPAITKPTRFPSDINQQPSLLDHIWINSLSHFTSGILCSDVTDHCPTFISYSKSCKD